MKIIMPMLAMLFMVDSLVLPVSTMSNTTQVENDVASVSLTDIAHKIKPLEIVEVTSTPTPDPYKVALENMQSEIKEIKSISDEKECFIAYKNIVFKYSEWIDAPETVLDYLTEEEFNLICQVVETECYGGDFKSKCNVANVVFNRFYDGRFGDTLEEVITSPCQFAYFRDNITEDSILAVMYAFEIEDSTNGALFFHSNNKTDKFCGAKYIFTDEVGHHFYK